MGNEVNNTPLFFQDIPLLGYPEIEMAALNIEKLDIESGLLSETGLISPQRRAHALQYLRADDRRRSLGATLVLDHLLQRHYLHERDQRYDENAHHKPYFKDHPEWQFSLSHSGQFALCALSTLCVGVDIQEITPFQQGIARLCMQPEEIKEINDAPIGLQNEMFTTCWCLKEAVLKAIGTGIGDVFPIANKQNNHFVVTDSRFPKVKTQTFQINSYIIALAVVK